MDRRTAARNAPDYAALAETSVRRLSVIFVGTTVLVLVVGGVIASVLSPSTAKDTLLSLGPIVGPAICALIYWSHPKGKS